MAFLHRLCRQSMLFWSFSSMIAFGKPVVRFGLMIEDIDHSLDGGLSSQLLRNNGFQGDNPDLTAYHPIGNAVIARDTENPISAAITSSLKITTDSTTGQVGFSNEGYWGIPCKNANYHTSFWFKGTYTGDITVQILGHSDQTEYASQTFRVNSSGGSFEYFEDSISVKNAPNGNNRWTLSLDAEKIVGGAVNVGLPTLQVPSWKSRSNGMKYELAEVIDELEGQFLRFPGGNNLEGRDENERWKWNETIGPHQDRPGRQGDWGYANTDAFGLMEFLQWAEDMALSPIPVIWNGFALYGGGRTPFVGHALDPYIADSLNELEFMLGSVNTTYGALRAKFGHPDPFPIKFVQIGNEDDHNDRGCQTYPERFQRYYDAIHAIYPDLIVITSTDGPACLPHVLPENVWLDHHIYSDPDSMVKDYSFFDGVSRTNHYVVFEYAVSQRDPPEGTNALWPYMKGSCAEAAFLLGLENNADLVGMAAYAPLLANMDGGDYTPNMISFRNNDSTIIKSTSYYVQKIFQEHQGDTMIGCGTAGPTLIVCRSKDSKSHVEYTRYVNYNNYSVPVQAHSYHYQTVGKLTLLSGPEHGSNTVEEPDLIVPEAFRIPESAYGTWNFELPPWSVAAMKIY